MIDRDRKVFFVVSCARSGSTSLARILDTAENGICAVEPAPNLNRETRDMMEDRIADPMAILESTVIARVREKSKEVEVYGEKNLTYGPFIPYLYKTLKCKFIFLKRDGRDVVRSLINWHNKKFGSIYRECKETGKLSPEAISAASSLLVHQDTSDYSRPRPLKGDPLYDEWENLTRAEMCTYYWSVINELYLDKLERLPDDAWITIDYSSVNPDDIKRIGEFCGLKGLERDEIQRMLDRRINSLEDRNSSTVGLWPHWSEWNETMLQDFDNIAAKTMCRLGYYQDGK